MTKTVPGVALRLGKLYTDPPATNVPAPSPAEDIEQRHRPSDLRRMSFPNTTLVLSDSLVTGDAIAGSGTAYSETYLPIDRWLFTHREVEREAEFETFVSLAS